ncbi:MAG: cation diffusion facilitator family transporter [Bacteroidota bacterium]
MFSKTRIMLIVVIIGVLLMVIKFFAWYITKSNAILTDALESIINVVAGFFALFSVHYASKPKDVDHPYGHGKIEFFSAGIEGSLIFIAGISMVIKAGYGFFHKTVLEQIDFGLWLSVFTALVNFIMGRVLINHGNKQNSPTLIADGKHLVSDTISTVGLVVGLLIILLTGKFWIDNLLTVFLGLWIIYTGFNLVRESVGNLLDETDMQVVNNVINHVNQNRSEKWIDMHNLRVLKHGSYLHIDCHITLPFYFSLEEAHDEVTKIENLIKKDSDNEVDLFIHSDPCIPSSCAICRINDCPVRKQEFVSKKEWTSENVLPDRKHNLD